MTAPNAANSMPCVYITPSSVQCGNRTADPSGMCYIHIGAQPIVDATGRISTMLSDSNITPASIAASAGVLSAFIKVKDVDSVIPPIVPDRGRYEDAYEEISKELTEDELAKVSHDKKSGAFRMPKEYYDRLASGKDGVADGPEVVMSKPQSGRATEAMRQKSQGRLRGKKWRGDREHILDKMDEIFEDNPSARQAWDDMSEAEQNRITRLAHKSLVSREFHDKAEKDGLSGGKIPNRAIRALSTANRYRKKVDRAIGTERVGRAMWTATYDMTGYAMSKSMVYFRMIMRSLFR